MEFETEAIIPTDTEIDAAWDEAEAVDGGEQDEAEADQPKAEEPVKGETPQGRKTEEKEADQPLTFTLKHLDETRTVGRDEIIKLAQQGLDYERIRAERDQLRANRGQPEPAPALLQAKAAAEAREQALTQERRAQMGRFLKQFPAVQPNEIPNEVWGEVAKGESLTAAFTLHRNRQLEAELAAERQNRKNAQKTTGSLFSSASGEQQDEYDRWWNDD